MATSLAVTRLSFRHSCRFHELEWLAQVFSVLAAGNRQQADLAVCYVW
jgi:hypothetical protein